MQNNQRKYRDLMAKKNTQKSKSILIPAILTLVIIFAAILVILYINRDGIYNALTGNNSEIPQNSQLSENNGDNHENAALQNSSSDIPQDSQTESSDTDSLTDNNITDNPQSNYYEVDKSDFMQKMFDNAMTIPGSSKTIEQPPAGRSNELQNKIVPLSNDIPDPLEYFKNIIFLGDSVTSGFDLYKDSILFNDEKVLKDTDIVASTSYGVYNATKDVSSKTVHPIYDGKQMKSEDIIAKMDGKYIFICLGLNDLTWAKVNKYVEIYGELIQNIKLKNPGKKIVIMSVTPVVSGEKRGELDNNVIIEANNMLIEFANENNIPFIDYAAAIRDSDNSLYKDLSSDGYCHIKVEAYDRIVEYLLHHPVA